jgi:FAD/FMN-containing dehydrogenase/Fe-S oxidoreductase
VDSLERELSAAITGEVRFDDGTRSVYAVDASNYRQIPIGVVIPRTEDDVVRALEICRRHNAPVLGRGAGTSIAGQCCNVAVVFDYSKYMNQVLEVNAAEGYAWVQPGCILDDLRAAAEEHHLTFGPDPATHDRCTLGGMIGNNSCGVHSVMAGRTQDNIEALDILTYDGQRMTVSATSPAELEAKISAGGREGEIYAALRELRNRYAGEVRTKFPVLPRRVSGYNLEELLPENGFNLARALVGTEGTCVTILRAKVRLVHSPPARMLMVLGYPDVYHAADHVMEILRHKPVGLEGMDDYLLNFLKKKHSQKIAGKPQQVDVQHKRSADRILPPGRGWLLVEFGGEDMAEARAKCEALVAALAHRPDAPSMKIMEDPTEEKTVWEVRKSGLGATAFLPGGKNTWPGWEDAAVPPQNLGKYLRDFNELRQKFGYECAMYGHFGDGCIHMRIDFDMVTREGIDKFLHFLDEAADLVVRYGGSISGEHGDGHARAHLLGKMFGPDLLHAFRLFKGIWDPDNRMNPGKLVDPYRPDEFLRLGAGYKSWSGDTQFQYPESENSFGRALLRCVGVGKCRRVDAGGTMCPSFMVTREEKHSTRGRAHLLQDMLKGDVISDGWKNAQVKESLDLCLACKGCKSDCPVNVDMATYKAEFLFNFYKGRFRPAASYAMGWIYWWARLSSTMPRVVNFFTQNAVTGALMKRLGGIAHQRPMPKFAEQTFKDWLAENDGYGLSQPGSDFHRPAQTDTASTSFTSGHTANRPSMQRVILWADTFNNNFTPATLRAGYEVLQDAGFDVTVPTRSLCCGRPLYDHGFLGMARKLLQEIMTVLRADIEAGTPIVGLEPSCVAVFRDELANLFADDPIALKLSAQVFTLSEFLARYAPDYHPGYLNGDAIFHLHCHQKSVLTTAPDEHILRQTGLHLSSPDTGCCGMAGAFGFDKHNYDVSVAVGERVLLPAARNSSEETMIITDGFSCREQVEQLTGRKVLHVAQVLNRAIRARKSGEQ